MDISPRHWKHLASSASHGRSTQWCGHLREARVGEPDRQRRASDGARRNRARRRTAGSSLETRSSEYTGGSTGTSLALVCAAKVVTLMADSGLKYLSTDVYGHR
jgi:hypothetical protein